ncbi:F510_1955 family glycosylhydrolase [Micromonospora sp. WMMC250]|uniref:F510_1955 family glycosylhydrolase n=1 Tax=Micromonospora sp. WMMC250 TaxID=3014781 RepID=UPI0022B6CAB9|nr:glycosyl hydrolase [Micromonospora sp. WMMC250]MCZ7379833.1 glycosyl hydrolase [Micromonospora sp. WMMC250]
MAWIGVAVGVLLLVTAAATVVGWRDDDAPSTASAASNDGRLSHVHGLGVNPADGQLYVATHHGVFRLPGTAADRVGDGRQDTMGFTVTGPDEFLASGHPAPDEDGPAHLGLIHSNDAGRSWQALSLAGQADFHLLRFSGGVVYGLDSSSGALMASSDRMTWETRSTLEAYDLAVDPHRPGTLLASTEKGLRRSTDGGRTWTPAGGPPAMLLHWSARELVAIMADGTLVRSVDAAATWSSTPGRTPGAPAALTVYENVIYLATRDGRVLRSSDAGVTWQPMLP